MFLLQSKRSHPQCPVNEAWEVGWLPEENDGTVQPSAIPRPGHGHATRTTTSRWLLETFTDSDWSGAKGRRRSTSAAVHMLNGAVLLTSSRGQKSVSLSSAEAELNALVSGAAGGIYLRRCLEFLMEENIMHYCSVDNSAALHLCHRKGPGQLRHIAGKLLWAQDMVAQGDLEVKAVGTVATWQTWGPNQGSGESHSELVPDLQW